MAAKKRNKRPAKTATNKRSKKAAASSQQSVRRETAALCLLALTFFFVLSLFWRHSIVGILRDFGQGLIGAGYYVLPLFLLLVVRMLFTGRGKKQSGRIAVTLLICIVVGTFLDVCLMPDRQWSRQLIGTLYAEGKAGPAGGVITGLLSMLLCTCFSKFGAIVLLLLLFFLCLLAPLNSTPKALILAIRNRPKAEKEPEPAPDVAQKLVNHIAQSQLDRAEARKKARESFQVDLPVDDPPLPERKKKTSLREPEAISPDQYLLEQRKLEKQKREAEADTAKREDVMPLPLITDLIERNQSVAKESAPQTALQEEPARWQQSGDLQPAQELEPSAPSVQEDSQDAAAPLQEEMPADAAAQAAWEDALPEHAPAEEAEVALAESAAQAETFDPEPAEDGQLGALTKESLTAQAQAAQKPQEPVYVFPPLSLLNAASSGAVDATEEMRLNAERLSDALRSFGIEPNLVNVTRGPTVTRYELQLNRGVKLAKITGLSEDIALALGATGVRISAIPEKISVVGIEVPNHAVSTVYIREVLDSREFSSSKSKLSFAVGKDIGGNRVIGNIAKLPHLLIAGTTGSGKSVCMNSLIVSLLYKSSPEDVRMIMIDPKMVELGIYNGIPHLLIPVVTDPKKASGSLQWAVAEMMRRYSIMAESGARDIASYNRVIADNPERKKLPQIVVVIDELADLMLVAAKEVEESICRVAQMGRAAGVHLVIATQRPSANVITGLMKANIPSRIAFAVASAMESRIILDSSGAEKLVGRGDMLYAPLGEGKARRIQGCFITDEEVGRVTSFVKKRGQADYSKEIMEQIEKKAEQAGKGGGNLVSAASEPENDRDELLYDAVDTILDLGQASVSVLQRKLKLGYSRASRIVDQMEEMGVVGPHKGSKPRDILITKEKWEAVKAGLEQLQEPVPDELD